MLAATVMVGGLGHEEEEGRLVTMLILMRRAPTSSFAPFRRSGCETHGPVSVETIWDTFGWTNRPTDKEILGVGLVTITL